MDYILWYRTLSDILNDKEELKVFERFVVKGKGSKDAIAIRASLSEGKVNEILQKMTNEGQYTTATVVYGDEQQKRTIFSMAHEQQKDSTVIICDFLLDGYREIRRYHVLRQKS
jgi:hypothetical protein